MAIQLAGFITIARTGVVPTVSKEYLVTTIDKVRTTYIVPAESEEEARRKIEHPEESYKIDTEEFYELDRIEEVQINE